MYTFQDLIEYFSDRPEVQSNLRDALDAYWGKDYVELSKSGSLAACLAQGFIFPETPQGHEYWQNILNELRKLSPQRP